MKDRTQSMLWLRHRLELVLFVVVDNAFDYSHGTTSSLTINGKLRILFQI